MYDYDVQLVKYQINNKQKNIKTYIKQFNDLKKEILNKVYEDTELDGNKLYGKYWKFRQQLIYLRQKLLQEPDSLFKTDLLNDLYKYEIELTTLGMTPQDNKDKYYTGPMNNYIGKYKNQFYSLKKDGNNSKNEDKQLAYNKKFTKYATFRNKLVQIKKDVLAFASDKQKKNKLFQDVTNYDTKLMQLAMTDYDMLSTVDTPIDFDNDDYAMDADEWNVLVNKVK